MAGKPICKTLMYEVRALEMALRSFGDKYIGNGYGGNNAADVVFRMRERLLSAETKVDRARKKSNSAEQSDAAQDQA